MRLLLTDEFLRRFRSIGAGDRKSQCKEPLLTVRLLQEPTDLLIQSCYDVRWRTRGCDHDQPAAKRAKPSLPSAPPEVARKPTSQKG